MHKPSFWMRFVIAFILVATAGAQEFGPWSAPEEVRNGVDPFLSKDGLTFHFSGTCGTGTTTDLCYTVRDTLTSVWQTPVNLGANVNSPYVEHGSALSFDEHWLFFNSNRTGDFDLYVSRRHNRRDRDGWDEAQNLGPDVNRSGAGLDEAGASFYEDEATGVITLFFESNRPAPEGVGDFDIYTATLQPDGTFADVHLVPELSSARRERHPMIRRDGLEIFFGSNRTGSVNGSLDLWVARRNSTSEPWSAPQWLGGTINSSAVDGHPALSFDGTELYFHSMRSSVWKIYVIRREKISD